VVTAAGGGLIEHEAGDLTCTVEAGMTLAALNVELARRGQMLALDPPAADRLTVGGAFSTAAFGPRAHRYGMPRDLILGVRVRLADGTLARGGGKVVKNVAGYDLPKLFTGAGGLLGELLELTVRLHPLPAATCTVVAQPCDPLLLEPVAPACVEYAWPEPRMLVRFESRAARALAERAQGLVGGELVEDDEELWAAHRELAAGLQLHRCAPPGADGLIAELQEAGASRIAGRYARGLLFADVAVPDRELTPLERRVVERFGAA
jgi:glycolate oxidase FAD binding subunit